MTSRSEFSSALPGCGRPASRRLEIYAPGGQRPDTAPVAKYQTCAAHLAMGAAAVIAAGLVPRQVPDMTEETCAGPCGGGTDLSRRPHRLITPPDDWPRGWQPPVDSRTIHNLVHAGIVAADLPAPEHLTVLVLHRCVYLVPSMYLTEAVDRWSAWFGLPAPTYKPLAEDDGRIYVASCAHGELPALPGWAVQVSCQVTAGR